MVTAIVVKLELGHIAKARDLPTFSGHTHDWMVFVKGAEGTDIAHFVEKVVFWLHESYDPPKCVVKQPPYEVQQTGYAGFKLLIDIHFKNKSEPKSVRFHYNMFLHTENMPPVNHTRVEMLTFTNPAEDFRSKLLCAGGVLKNQDSPDAPVKEKKSSKESRHSEGSHKSSHKSKDKTSIKNTEKHKDKHAKRDEKRRNSVDENDYVRKKREEFKAKPSPSSGTSADKKSKDKVNKIKIKLEKNATPSLFSREESINMKQIKKKDNSKKDDLKSEKEKRFTVEQKVKKEYSDKTPESSKITNRKISPEKGKLKSSSETKIKKRRTMSSSDSDIDIPKRTVTPTMRSEEERTIKRHKKDKIKELKQSGIKSKKSSTPQHERKISPPTNHSLYATGNQPVVTDMEICQTPPNENAFNQATKSSKSTLSSNAKRQKSSKSSENTRVTSSGGKVHIKDVKKKSSLNTMRNKDISSHKKQTSKPDNNPKRETNVPQYDPVISSSSSDTDSSDDEVVKRYAQSPAASPTSSSSISPPLSPINSIPSLLPPLLKDNISHSDSMDDFNVPSPIQPIRDVKSTHEVHSPLMSSDPDETVFRNSPPQFHNTQEFECQEEEKKFSTESVNKRRPVVQPETKFPAVKVGVGKELRQYPGLNEEMFEKLRELQGVLAAVTDENRLKKIVSIVRKSGNFTMVGNAVDFDLCSLDRKTIHRIQKHLKVS